MKQQDEIHFWRSCHHCDVSPILGTRYECQSCPAGPDVDLCESCFKLYQQNKISHPAEKSRLISTDEHHFIAQSGDSSLSALNWLNVQKAQGDTPNVAKSFLVRPEFRIGYESVFAGYGFIVNSNRGRLLLTALHVLDELIKTHNIDVSIRNEDYNGTELPALIDSAHMYDVMQEQWMFHELGSCDTMLVLPDARLGEEEPISYRDICAFTLNSSAKADAANLAKQSPVVGEPVWLISKMAIGSTPRKAVVVENNQHSFIFRYDNNESLPKACSGAPIVNRNGEVVAINVGGGYFENCRFGHGNHVESIRNHLAIL